MSPSFDRIQAAAVDGRAHNVYYRQDELQKLCKTLLANSEEIQQAIKDDYGHTFSEVAVEFNLTLAAVRRAYASLQPDKAHEKEYLVANGKDAQDHRVPFGIVYIEPTTHTMFHSVIVPLSWAIATGNCVVLLLENKLRAISSLLRRMLSAALDSETFDTASSPIVDRGLLDKVLRVAQTGSELWPKANELASPSMSRNIAVVDRTADVQVAAQELVSARFSFGGTSPYAPDIVLVNEFVKKDFLQAVVSQCVSLGSAIEVDGAGEKSKPSNKVSSRLSDLKKIDAGLRVILQENRFAVVDLPSRLQQIPESKVEAPVLVISSMRSLDDAIDLVGRSSKTPYNAAYHFSDLPSGKYLSQFIDSALACVNHIPRELLIGPASPATWIAQPDQRYSPDMFERPKPTFVHPTSTSSTLTSALLSSNNLASQKLLASAKAPLAAMKRNPGGGVGFFEQGFLMSASLVLVSVVTVSGTGAWYAWKYARPLW